MNSFVAPNFRSRTLTRYDLQHEALLGVEYAVDPTYQSHLRRDMLMRMTAYVWSEQLGDESFPVIFKVPSSWWQHLKADWNAVIADYRWKRFTRFLQWAKMRYDCVEVVRKVNVRTHVLLPGLDYVAPPGCATVIHREVLGVSEAE